MSRTQPNFVLMPGDEVERSPIDSLRRRALRLLKEAEDAPGPRGRVHTPGFAAPAALGPINQPRTRALAVGVVTMPAVFVAVVLIALALFGKPSQGRKGPVSAEIETLAQPLARGATGVSLVSTTGFANEAIGLAEDSRVEDISLDGDHVAIHVESPRGAEIVIYDYVQRRVIASAPITVASMQVDDRLAYLTGAPRTYRSVVSSKAAPVIATKSDSTPPAPRVKPDEAN